MTPLTQKLLLLFLGMLAQLLVAAWIVLTPPDQSAGRRYAWAIFAALVAAALLVVATKGSA